MTQNWYQYGYKGRRWTNYRPILGTLLLCEQTRAHTLCSLSSISCWALSLLPYCMLFDIILSKVSKSVIVNFFYLLCLLLLCVGCWSCFFIVPSLDTIHSMWCVIAVTRLPCKKNATIQTHTKATTKLVRQIKPKTATKEPASRRNTHKNGNTEQMNLNKCFGQMRHGRRMEWFLWAYYNRKGSMKSKDSCLFLVIFERTDLHTIPLKSSFTILIDGDNNPT